MTNHRSSGTVKRAALRGFFSLLLLAGCQKPEPQEGDCTLIGCDSGIEVILENPPAGPYTVEASVYDRNPRYVYECERPDGCKGRAEFLEFTPYRLVIDVVSASGSERYEVVPTYVESRPNGPSCAPLCRRATVRLPSDDMDPRRGRPEAP